MTQTITRARVLAIAIIASAAVVPATSAGAQSPPKAPQGITGGGTDKIGDSAVHYMWRISRNHTTATRLTARQVPGHANVTLRCLGGRKRGCPLRTRRFDPSGGSVDMTSVLRKARLRPGAILEVLITAPNEEGKCVHFRMRKFRLPATTVRKLPATAEEATSCVA